MYLLFHNHLITYHTLTPSQVHVVLSEVSSETDGMKVGCESDSDDEEEEIEVRGEEEDLSDTDPEDEWNTPQSV